jgi:predicted kinase
MCGLPFSGKSIAARRLAAVQDADIVELDAINTELGIGLSSMPITPDEWSQSYKESYSRLHRLLVAGRSAIFDATNFTRVQRDEVRQLAKDVGSDAVVVYVRLTRAEAQGRLLENRVKHRRHDLRDEDFAQVADNFEEPGDDEVTIFVSN